MASAHISALDYLVSGGESCALNVGYGHGVSIRGVIASVKRLAANAFKVVEAEGRPGDPPILVADNTRLIETLGWSPQYDSLDAIVQSALAWEKKQLGEGTRNCGHSARDE